MSSCIPANLIQRNICIKSQKLFWNFLDTDIINKLVHLFANNTKYSTDSISKYIVDERKTQGLDISDVDIESCVYGHHDSNSTLLLSIKKNNINFLHLTFHLTPHTFNPKHAGLIHMFKDFYKNKNPNKIKKKLYVLIFVKQNKPKSLEFSIADGYTTTGVYNSNLYDQEIQKEMNVVITVLNRMFDEDDTDFYIGDTNKLYPIHNNTNNVLDNINRHTQHISRKNKGDRIYSVVNNKPSYIFKSDNYTKKTPKSKSKCQITRKKHKLTVIGTVT